MIENPIIEVKIVKYQGLMKNKLSIKIIKNGIDVNKADIGTPIFLPHERQVAEDRGPSRCLRQKDIAGCLQYGHLFIDAVTT
jgi:hypothetical protein